MGSLDWKDFLLAFIPLFVAIDAIGNLPFFISLTQGLAEDKRIKVVRQSVLTALSIGLGFLFVGRLVLRALGIEVYDFQVAGGLILLVFAVRDLLFEPRVHALTITMGIVPLGTPLLVGPAVLTILLICVDSYGYLPTITSLVTNMLLVWVVFSYSTEVNRFLGEGGSMAFAKVALILLGAIAIMMIRKGVLSMLA